MAPDNVEHADSVITFAEGIPGFPDLRRFVLVNFAENSAFQMLECLDDEDVAMVVGSPWLFFPDYQPELSDVDQQGLDLDDAADAVVFCPVTIGEDGGLTMNLLGPFVVNGSTRQGRQIVLVHDAYSVRTPIPVTVG